MLSKGCIFDLDGVIVNTSKYHYLAWKRLAYELGFDFKIEDNELLKGIDRIASLDILLKIGNKSVSSCQKEKMLIKKNAWYIEYISNMNKSEILPGILEFLNLLKNNNIKVALASSSKNSNLVLQRLELKDYFDVIIDGNNVKNAKPDPEVFLTAIEKMELISTECVVFEDSQAGIYAAKAANINVIAVGNSKILLGYTKIINTFRNISLDLIDF